MSVVNIETVKDLLNYYGKLMTDINDVTNALTKMGHKLNTELGLRSQRENLENIENAKLDERLSVKLLLKEWNQLNEEREKFLEAKVFFDQQ